MVLWKIEGFFGKKKAEEAKKRQEENEIMVKEKEEVSILFGTLSDKWRDLCLELLAETQYSLEKKSKDKEFQTELKNKLRDQEECAKINKIISEIKYRHAWHKCDCSNRLCTKYKIEKIFRKTQKDAVDEREEFEIMCENLAVDREEKRRMREEKRKIREEKRKMRKEKKNKK